jgi:hypothetical protein
VLLIKSSKGQNAVLLSLSRPASVPAVTISPSTATGKSQTGKPFSLTWVGTNRAAGPLTYDVAESCGGTGLFRHLAVGLTVSSLRVDPASLCTGKMTFRVSVSNGFTTASVAGGGIQLPARSPRITVFQTGNGAAVAPGSLVTLAGQAIDSQDGILGSARLTWTSDRDGFLGSGPVLDTADLSIGLHHITFAAAGPDGQSAAQTVTLTVARSPHAGPQAGQPGTAKPTAQATATPVSGAQQPSSTPTAVSQAAPTVTVPGQATATAAATPTSPPSPGSPPAPTSTATGTPVPSTATPTNTPVPPTATSTLAPPTDTATPVPPPPTDTATTVPPPSDTATTVPADTPTTVPADTATSVPPADTPTSTT